MDFMKDHFKPARSEVLEMFGMGGNEKASAEVVKYPIRRVEVTIQKFIKVLEMDLERLKKHQKQILKLQRIGDYVSLNKEQTNASRTVQQLSSNLKQLEQTRNQVQTEDLKKFDSMVRHVRDLAESDLEEFLSLHCQQITAEASAGTSDDLSTTELKTPVACRTEIQSHTEGSPTQTTPTDKIQLQEVESQSAEDLQSIKAQHDAAEQSWLELEQNITDLNDVMKDFSQLVHNQQQTVDSIEDKIDDTQTNIQEGTSYLAQAAKLKGAFLPVVGALIGGSLAGPIGLVAGLKVGGVAALGGGIMGLTGGTLLKKRREALINEDMEDIHERERQTILLTGRL